LELDAGAQIPGGMTRANHGRTFVAQWNADSIYVALDVHQSGRPYIVTNPTSVRVTFGQYFGTLPAPTGQPTSLTFLGWRFHPTSGAAVPITPTTRLTANMLRNGIVTLRANWQVQGGGGQLPTQWHTVTFNANGGTFPAGTNTQVLVQHNHTPTIAQPTRAGWTFNGWSPSGAATSSHTRFAQWTQNQDPGPQIKQVQFNPNNGTWVDRPYLNVRTFSFNIGQQVTAPPITRSNHALAGWTQVIHSATSRTYTAQWNQQGGGPVNPQTIRVTFNPNSGTWTSGANPTGTRAWDFQVGTTPLPLIGLTRTNYELIAWDITSGTATTNHTLTARWRRINTPVVPTNTYRIEFRIGNDDFNRGARFANSTQSQVVVTFGRNHILTYTDLFGVGTGGLRNPWENDTTRITKAGHNRNAWTFANHAVNHSPTNAQRIQVGQSIANVVVARGLTPVNNVVTIIVYANWVR